MLLHKDGKDPNILSSYLPITVLNADYKIFASLIVTHIGLWPDLISPQQTSSVPTRNISALSLTRDKFAYAHYTENVGSLLSLNEESTFDRVTHSYLYETLGAYRFPSSFIDVIRALYQDLNSDLIINGLNQDSVPVGRGVRQGTPSPPCFSWYV